MTVDTCGTSETKSAKFLLSVGRRRRAESETVVPVPVFVGLITALVAPETVTVSKTVLCCCREKSSFVAWPSVTLMLS